MKVVFYHRKNPHKYVSIEAYFDNIRKHLPPEIQAVVAEAKYYSNGLFKRIFNAIEAVFKQGDVNHITGDVHYLAIVLKKKKTLLTIHDLVFLQHPSPIARKVLKLFWLTLPVKRAGHISAVSEATRREIINLTNCPPDKISVIPTCIGTHFTRVDKSLNSERPVLLQIGTAPNKNLIRMAKAISGLNCRLEIVGQPTEDYLNTLKEEKIDYRFSTHLSDGEMLNKYVECDVVLFASTYEGFGMPIIEGNTVGRVVVTSNISSMPEVAKDAACLVDPYDVSSIRDGIEKVIRDDAYRSQLIENGFRNAMRFKLEHVAMQYADIYKTLDH